MRLPVRDVAAITFYAARLNLRLITRALLGPSDTTPYQSRTSKED